MKKNSFRPVIHFISALILCSMIILFARPEIRADAGTDSFEPEEEMLIIESSTPDENPVSDDETAEESFVILENDAGDSASAEKIPLSSLSLKNSSMGYTGSPVKQNSGITVTAVTDGQKTVLTRWTDYTISYQDNVEVGTATVTVKGKGLYTGSLSKTFKIVPRGTTLQSVEPQTRRILVKWKTPPTCADGIQIQYSTSKDFSSDCRFVMIKNTTTVSKTITGLTAGKTYYVRLRSYKKADGKNFYSGYGKPKSVKLVKNAVTVNKTANGKRTLILDNAPVSALEIRFGVWSGRFGQDDLVWYKAEKLSNGRWKAAFKSSNHRNDGSFYIDVYEKDTFLVRFKFQVHPSETATANSILAESLNTAADNDQLILVGAQGISCTLTMLNKNTDGSWHQLLSTSGNVGSNGIGEVTEWNRKTPVGVYGFCKAFGIYSDPGTKLKYTKVDSSHYWVDDVNSKYYNQFVSTKNTPVSWSSAEHIIDYTNSYQYCLALDFNKDCVPGAGSAIFLHAGSGSPTLGCIAVPLDQMKKIMQYVIPGCKIIIDTPENLKNY